MAEKRSLDSGRDTENPKRTASKIASSRQKKVVGGYQKLVRCLAGLALGGALVVAVHSNRQNEPQPPAAARTPSPKEKKNTFIVDGITIVTSSVPEAAFRAAYEKAKHIVGGPYWHPNELSVEYGNVDDDRDQTLNVSGITDDNKSITTDPGQLAHELVHFLLGPGAQKLPRVLQEFFACAANEAPAAQYTYGDLDQAFIQMPADSYIENLASPLIRLRYAALHALGERHREKISQLAQQSMRNPEGVTFENLALFLDRFDIRHHIFQPATEEREYQTVLDYKDASKKGFLYVRCARYRSNGEGELREGMWSGGYTYISEDENGTRKESEEKRMRDGVSFIRSMGEGEKIKSLEIKLTNGQTVFRRQF